MVPKGLSHWISAPLPILSWDSAEEISDSALRKQIKMPSGGVLVSYIFPDDPADRAGIRENDVLKSWNDTDIECLDQLKHLIGESRVGDQIRISLIREGREMQIQVRLGGY